MAPESISFRITRHTEDLAQTIHTLSQRLVKLEQRLAAMELQISEAAAADPREATSLANVERLLQDCQQLLELQPLAQAAAAFADGQPELPCADDSLEADEEDELVTAA